MSSSIAVSGRTIVKYEQRYSRHPEDANVSFFCFAPVRHVSPRRRSLLLDGGQQPDHHEGLPRHRTAAFVAVDREVLKGFHTIMDDVDAVCDFGRLQRLRRQTSIGFIVLDQKDLNWRSIDGVSSYRNRKVEGGSLARFRFDPDSPAVAVHDFLADRQTDARAVILLAGVQAMEHLKDMVLKPGVDTNTIVCAPRTANSLPRGRRPRESLAALRCGTSVHCR